MSTNELITNNSIINVPFSIFIADIACCHDYPFHPNIHVSKIFFYHRLASGYYSYMQSPYTGSGSTIYWWWNSMAILRRHNQWNTEFSNASKLRRAILALWFRLTNQKLLNIFQYCSAIVMKVHSVLPLIYRFSQTFLPNLMRPKYRNSKNIVVATI